MKTVCYLSQFCTHYANAWVKVIKKSGPLRVNLNERILHKTVEEKNPFGLMMTWEKKVLKVLTISRLPTTSNGLLKAFRKSFTSHLILFGRMLNISENTTNFTIRNWYPKQIIFVLTEFFKPFSPFESVDLVWANN